MGKFQDSSVNRDKEALPKRLKDVKKERVMLIEKNSTLCDNVGTGFIDLQT